MALSMVLWSKHSYIVGMEHLKVWHLLNASMFIVTQHFSVVELKLYECIYVCSDVLKWYLTIASFPGLPHLQLLIDQNLEVWKAWERG